MQRFGALVRPAASESSPEMMDRLMLELFRRADHRGSDVRLDVGVPFRYNAWPRVSVDEKRWVWKHAVTMKFTRQAHINELELTMVHNALRWRMRHFRALGTRVCFFVDSQVTVSVAAKGRSSSRKLNAILCRLNALCLATFSAPFFLYIHTSVNPADAPSQAPWVFRG